MSQEGYLEPNLSTAYSGILDKNDYRSFINELNKSIAGVNPPTLFEIEKDMTPTKNKLSSVGPDASS